VRVAVISDIHANWPALEAVAGALKRERPDAVWCLGDLVGYGPQPNECCQWAAERADLCLAGNHDLGVVGTEDLALFSHDAAEAALWTRRILAGDAGAYLRGLRASDERDGIGLFHASPLDPVWHYVLSQTDALASLAETAAPVVLVGHTHVPTLASAREFLWGRDLDGFEVDLSHGRWLINPGSVGQPRDQDARAAWLLLDLERRRALFRRLAYPVARTQAEIRERGLPAALADRLAHGV
jgi:predicted phosphodiesterase